MSNIIRYEIVLRQDIVSHVIYGIQIDTKVKQIWLGNRLRIFNDILARLGTVVEVIILKLININSVCRNMQKAGPADP